MSEAGSLVVGGLPGRNAATTTITTKTMPPSAPHRSHLLSSMVPLLFPADVPAESLGGGCAGYDRISSTDGCAPGSEWVSQETCGSTSDASSSSVGVAPRS